MPRQETEERNFMKEANKRRERNNNRKTLKRKGLSKTGINFKEDLNSI